MLLAHTPGDNYNRYDHHGAGLSPVGDTGLLLLGIPLNTAILMKFAPMGPFMTELYPTDIRGTGQGFCYNAGRAIGSIFLTAIGFATGFATAIMPLGAAIVLFSTLAHALMIVMLLVSETRGRVEMFGASITAKTMARGAPQIFVDGDLNSPHGNNSNRLAPPTGFPAITVPMGFVHGTPPAGLQILGRPGSEPTLIKMGYAYEQATLHPASAG